MTAPSATTNLAITLTARCIFITMYTLRFVGLCVPEMHCSLPVAAVPALRQFGLRQAVSRIPAAAYRWEMNMLWTVLTHLRVCGSDMMQRKQLPPSVAARQLSYRADGTRTGADELKRIRHNSTMLSMLLVASVLPCAGNLREINRHLGYYCPECLQLAGSPTATSKPTEVPQTAEVRNAEVGSGEECTSLIKSICAPIYELKRQHVSSSFALVCCDSSHCALHVLCTWQCSTVQLSQPSILL